MDAIDLKLITLLQKNARMPLKELANRVYLSSPATAARLEKLEKSGYIEGYHLRVDLKGAGFPVVAFISLDLSPEQKPTFYPAIQQNPNVMECYCITGRFSQLLKVAFPSTEALDIFINELQQYGHTQTQIAFSNPKSASDIGLQDIFERDGLIKRNGQRS